MAKDTIDFGGVPKDIRHGGGGGHLPEGDHLVKIAKVEKRWKDNDRANVPYYNWHFQAVNGQHKGTTVYHRTSLKPEALFSLRNLIHAVTKKNVAGSKLAFDPLKLVGKQIGITCQDNEFTKNKGKSNEKTVINSEVVDVFPADELEDRAKDDEEAAEEEDEDTEEVEEEDEDLEEVDLDEL